MLWGKITWSVLYIMKHCVNVWISGDTSVILSSELLSRSSAVCLFHCFLCPENVTCFPLSFIPWKRALYQSSVIFRVEAGALLLNVKVIVVQSCLTLWDPMDCSPPGFSAHGILQARILEWVAIPFPRGSSWPRDQTQISYIAGRFFTIWATRKGLNKYWSTASISSDLVLRAEKIICSNSKRRDIPSVPVNIFSLSLIYSVCKHFGLFFGLEK